MGPTASGKHSVGLALAERLGAEILSLDSMKVYRGMDVGTAKPSAEARARVPHHLIDLADPAEEFSVARYLGEALSAVEEVLGRGRLPLFVGGTGLYLRALVRGLFEGPATDLAVRERLVQGDPSSESLHAGLAEIDPRRAAQLHPNDRKRILRALEIHAQTGRPMSAWIEEARHQGLDHPHRIFWLDRDRADLDERIDRRTRRLFEDGFVEEVRALEDRMGRQAAFAIGYPEVREYLSGAMEIEECIGAVAKATRLLARKQRTWFRSFPEILRFPVGTDDTAGSLAARMAHIQTR